ncbi:MAG: hypothetical protein JWL80_66 [Parcubacteria group bacterium]|nr:hypothetical protein [Parcubacteria group bacterium]
MVLSTHAVVGAAVATLIPTHPILGGVLAIVSHFALDAIPHWDYKVLSDSLTPDRHGKLRFDTTLLIDFIRIGGDFFLGILAAWFFLSSPIHPWIWIIGVAGGVFPDFLWFVYAKWKHEPLITLQTFHEKIQTHHIDNPILGESIQIAICALFIFLAR